MKKIQQVVLVVKLRLLTFLAWATGQVVSPFPRREKKTQTVGVGFLCEDNIFEQSEYDVPIR